MRLLKVIAIAATSVAVSGAGLEAEARPRDVLINMAQEAVECASFFVLVTNAMENAGRTDSAEGYFAWANSLLAYAHGIAEQAGQLPQAIDATLEMVRRDHLSEISNDLANLAILSERYLPICPQVIQDPEARFDYWQRALGLPTR